MTKPQLFCFTCAGGGASFYDEIEKELPELELVKIEYPGHGARRKEPFCKSFEALADDAFRECKARYTGGAYGLFGYSMGSITAVEVMQRIVQEGSIPLPQRVFLAAHEPHTKVELEGFSPEELDDWVKERTVQFGALPDKLIHNKAYWRLYLPLFRADYTLISKYRFENLVLQTTVPVMIFYSETDTPYKEMELWTNYFVGRCEFVRYEGRHFFIQQHHSDMADIVRTKMMESQETKNDI